MKILDNIKLPATLIYKKLLGYKQDNSVKNKLLEHYMVEYFINKKEFKLDSDDNEYMNHILNMLNTNSNKEAFLIKSIYIESKKDSNLESLINDKSFGGFLL